MSDFGENGFPPEAGVQGSDPHEEFRELCALSTTGELTEEERQKLKQHLAGCATCAKLLRDYEQVATKSMAVLGAEFDREAGREEAIEGADDFWSIEDAEARLLNALKEKPGADDKIISPDKKSLGSVALKLALAASILAASSFGFYHLGRLENRNSSQAAMHFETTERPVTSGKAVVPQTAAPARSNSDSSRQAGALEDKRITDLKQAIVQGKREREDLQAQLTLLTQELGDSNSESARIQAENSDLARELSQAQANSRSLEAKESQSGNQQGQGIEESIALKARIGDLNRILEAKDREIAQDQELLAHDRDIRNLISARNLYIAEIYDVGKSGDTEKPFGRIFYTKDKSLIFYGYDLDQQHGARRNSSFQAWGRRGSDDRRDVNLGLLYLDDTDKQRWVLKFSDSKTIAELDAIFITVEPPGGSSKPTTKPLLFTYLRLDPNHP